MLARVAVARGTRVGEAARLALGSIRLVNGAGALLVPEAVGRKLGVDPDANPSAPYVTRLFGVRTVLLGYELLQRDERARRRALRVAPLIHASDTAAAIIAGWTGALPRRAAITAAVISSVNTVLALTARRSAP
jgi:hypothetical protein